MCWLMTMRRSDGNPWGHCNLTPQGVPLLKVVLDTVIRNVLLGTMEGSTTICSLQTAGAGPTLMMVDVQIGRNLVM